MFTTILLLLQFNGRCGDVCQSCNSREQVLFLFFSCLMFIFLYHRKMNEMARLIQTIIYEIQLHEFLYVAISKNKGIFDSIIFLTAEKVKNK